MMGRIVGEFSESSSQMADVNQSSILLPLEGLGTDSQALAMSEAYSQDLNIGKSTEPGLIQTMIRILIVDDQRSIRERLKYILESEPDFEIVGMVDNGYDAIEQVKNIVPDVVLMDMEMPDIDGVLATKIIASSELNKKVRVLVLSSHDTSEYVARSIHAGAKGYLLKGASAEEIRDAVRFVHRGYTQIAPGLFEQFIPELPVKVNRVPIATNGSIPSDPGSSSGLSGLVITGFNIQRRVSDSAALVEPQPSNMLIDVVETRIGSKSASWAQVVAGMLLALGSIGSIYLIRQSFQQPQAAITASERAAKLQETPFTGKVEAQQSNKINAIVPGFIQEVKVKVGQVVRPGEVLMTIRNVEAERTNQEKTQQQATAAVQKQKADLEQKQSQQQQNLLQQQNIIQQQQQSQQRSSVLEQQIATQEGIVTPLRNKLSATTLQIDESQLQTDQKANIQKLQAEVQRTKYAYERQKVDFDAKTRSYKAQQELVNAGAGSRDNAEQARSNMNSAEISLNAARTDYENAQKNLTEARKNTTQPAKSEKLRIQQQLELKDQEAKITAWRKQLQQEQLSYQQLTANLQTLRQKSAASPAASSSTPAVSATPVLVEITAATGGTVVELPMNAGDQVFTGNKLVSIANAQLLKTTVEVDEKLAASLQTGRRTMLKIKSGNNVRDYTGRVANISPSGENRKQKIEINFQAGTDFLVGQSATVYFPAQQ
jgi:hemolysin D